MEPSTFEIARLERRDALIEFDFAIEGAGRRKGARGDQRRERDNLQSGFCAGFAVAAAATTGAIAGSVPVSACST
jgi:hypothetical protein